MKKILFNTDYDKLFSIIVYILLKLKKTDMQKICKILFYADKNHLNKYARPISGDIYIKMNNGPVPSIIYDMLKQNGFTFSTEFYEKIKKYLKVVDEYFVELKNKKIIFENKYFCETDLEELNNAIEFCKDKNFNELSDLTHKEKSWFQTCLNNEMDFSLFIDDDNKYKEDILEDLEENSQYTAI